MTRIDDEKHIVEVMVRLYCRHRHGHAALCADCAALLEYAKHRLDRCPHGEHKTSCRKCQTHCYASAMRQAMREVMRYSGPRMLIYHPLVFLSHALREKKTH